MIATIVWIAGVIAAVWCVLDIFKHNKLEPLFLAFSWVGFLVYYFLIRDKI